MPTTEQMHLETLRRRRAHLSSRLDERRGDSRNGMQYDRLELAALDWALEVLTEEMTYERGQDGSDAGADAGRLPGR